MFTWYTMDDAEFRTEQLLLRPPRRSDLDALDRAIQETLGELVRWLPWARPDHCRGDSRQYIRHARLSRARRSAFEYLLIRADTRKLVGAASLHRIDWIRRSAGLGYWVRRSEWGMGMATEAGRMLIAHAFHGLELQRVEAHVATGNKSSQRVVEKLGFLREGIAREIEFVDGRYLDHIQYSLIRGDILGSGR